MITREERRRIQLLSQLAANGRQRPRVAVAHAPGAHALRSRTARTGALLALALAGAVALGQLVRPISLDVVAWLEWMLPRVY